MFENIKLRVRQDFGQLCQFKERENTLEVITPFATVNNSFISVFVTQDSPAGYIVSDGAWLDDGHYGLPLQPTGKFFGIAKAHYQKALKIERQQVLVNEPGHDWYFKKPIREDMITAAILDMGMFLSNLINIYDTETDVEPGPQTDEIMFKTYVERSVINEVPFTLEQFVEVMQAEKPDKLYNGGWSNKKPFLIITEHTAGGGGGVEFYCNAWADKTPRLQYTLEELYNFLKYQGFSSCYIMKNRG